jgi:D-glycero-D-manno-heptose 1,7-bisphosphate phosphatase
VRRAVFLDRDGTLIEEIGYLDRLDRISVFPYSIDAVRQLNRAGFAVIVITNQAGVARGFFTEEFVGETHRHLASVFAEGGATIDGFYYCPHHPDGKVDVYRRRCECRKPQSGLLRQAAEEHQLDLARSFAVGDREHDLQAGAAVGAAPVLVRTGYGSRNEDAAHGSGAVVTDNLMAAVAWILRQP